MRESELCRNIFSTVLDLILFLGINILNKKRRLEILGRKGKRKERNEHRTTTKNPVSESQTMLNDQIRKTRGQ